MDAEIARNQNYDDHYANDSKDVHSALLPLQMMMRAVCSTAMYPAAVTVNWRHSVRGGTVFDGGQASSSHRQRL